jgi:acyl carrier protein
MRDSATVSSSAPPFCASPPAPGLSDAAPRLHAREIAPIGYSQTTMTIANARLEAEVIAIVRRVSRRPIEPTTESDLALDLGFDSLLVFELIAELEDRFDVSIPLNDIEKIRTIAQISDHLRALIEQQDVAR